MEKKAIVFIIIASFIFSSCATVQKEIEYTTGTAKNIDPEKESTYNLIKGGAALGGIMLGAGAVVMLKPGGDETIVSDTVKFGLLGGAVGYLIGMLVTDLLRQEEKPSEEKLKQYYQEYEWNKLKQ